MEYNYMANILMLVAIVSSVVATTMIEEELNIKGNLPILCLKITN